ncbi:MAG: amidohydrolase family protein [Gemmatimonadetes bacterium]|nr:amidohydrolase family protein [Gemmatimonadota bacterium]
MRARLAVSSALVLAVCLAWPGASTAQFTDPPPPAAYALQNVTVVEVDGNRTDSVTLVIRNGLIAAMDRGLAVPPDARLLEGDSLYVYPGLIDGDGEADFEFPEVEIDRGQVASWDPPRRVQGFSPSQRVVDYLSSTGEDVADQRQAGIVAAAIIPGDRVMPGRGATLIFRRNADLPAELIAEPVIGPAMYLSGAQGVYPATLFAVIAFYRQSFENARNYQAKKQAYSRNDRGVEPPKWDPDLEVMLDLMAGRAPAFFAADNGRDIQRVLMLAEEYGFRPIIVGGDEAWKVADELRAAEVPVLVSLDFPEPKRWKPAEDDGTNGDDELDAAALAEKQEIEAIYANAGRLAEAGVRFALTSEGGDADLLEGARKAIEYGLSEAAALRALTATPASLFGLERLTRIEQGGAATFIVTDGPLFAEDTEIRYTFVEGELERVKEGAAAGGEPPTVDITGTWDFEIDAEGQIIAAKMTVEQEGADFEGTMQTPFGEARVRDGVVSGNKISFTIVVETGEPMEVTAEGTVEGEEASGTGESPDGSFTWTAERTSGPGEGIDR